MYNVFHYSILILAVLFIGCDRTKKHCSASNNMPSVPPIWIVEDDPDNTIFVRSDLERDRKVDNILIIPLYMNYQYGSRTESLAIAHPFVYQQGGSLENKLSSFGQRDKLRSLIFLVPGYFPGSIGRVFPFSPNINGKKMIVLELQPCIGSEEKKISYAMKSLLLDGDFVIKKMLAWKVRPPYSDKPTQVRKSYDFTHLVRSQEYQGRFFKSGSANGYVLWGFKPGTKIVNCLSADEKKTVEVFFADVMNKDETD